MTTLEHDQLRGALESARDRHVFVSEDGRRQRMLRAAGIVAGGVALAWLLALGLAMAGSTRLPGLTVPAVREGAPTPARAATATPPAALSSLGALSRTPRPAPSTRRPAAHAAPKTTPAPLKLSPVLHRAPATRPASRARAAVTPPRGWARHGWTSPSGQAKQAGRPGRGRGHAFGAAVATTTHGNGHARD
ncbi:MAG TPA: hypothetical protein VE753_01720 [Gaiellaceae bacterium]|jgi:hypothetical protein|nr:hypothetical protein [Gaiellaceae bacterium]